MLRVQLRQSWAQVSGEVFLKKSKGCWVRGWFYTVTVCCLMLSLCYFVTFAEAGICHGMFREVAGNRGHNAARGGDGAFVGAGRGAARCSGVWYVLCAPHGAAWSLRRGVGNAVFGRSCSCCASGTSITHNSKPMTISKWKGRGSPCSQAATMHHCHGGIFQHGFSLQDTTSPWQCLWLPAIQCWQLQPSLLWWHCARVLGGWWPGSHCMSTFYPRLVSGGRFSALCSCVGTVRGEKQSISQAILLEMAHWAPVIWFLFSVGGFFFSAFLKGEEHQDLCTVCWSALMSALGSGTKNGPCLAAHKHWDRHLKAHNLGLIASRDISTHFHH